MSKFNFFSKILLLKFLFFLLNSPFFSTFFCTFSLDFWSLKIYLVRRAPRPSPRLSLIPTVGTTVNWDTVDWNTARTSTALVDTSTTRGAPRLSHTNMMDTLLWVTWIRWTGIPHLWIQPWRKLLLSYLKIRF